MKSNNGRLTQKAVAAMRGLFPSLLIYPLLLGYIV